MRWKESKKFVKQQSVSPMRKTCDANLRERRYSVIEKHPDIGKTILKQLSRLAVIKKTSDSLQTNSVYLPSAQMKNER